MSIYKYIKKIKSGDGRVLGYRVIKNKTYHSKRYNKTVSIKTTDLPYDGATGAMDIDSFGWLFHDVLCRDGCFDDGSECSNWQASQVLSDILKEEGRWFRSKTWFVATWFLGGGEARNNGMF
ncbi:MAG: hypothetical protein GY928_16510 [Colwellia sp.]|nr:hypothetical protein [Colwellia sp.]